MLTESTFVQFIPRALPGTLLFHDWTEALALWRRMVKAFPRPRSLCLMPNHLHLVTARAGARARLLGVMSGFARWRGHHRGTLDRACWRPLETPDPIPDDKHLRRVVRYVLLNPCRGELASDPLAWPLSSHRDMAGLGSGTAHRDPEGFHHYVSADRTVAANGTLLPIPHRGFASLPAIEVAVGSVLRLEPAELWRNRTAVPLLARAAWLAENQDTAALARWIGRSQGQVVRILRGCPAHHELDRHPRLRAVMCAVDDPRFAALALPPRATGTRWSGWRQA